jgi:hypothetical protein
MESLPLGSRGQFSGMISSDPVLLLSSGGPTSFSGASPGVDVMITIFRDFRQFSAEKIGVFFSKSNVMINNLLYLALFRVKNANFCNFFLRKYF